VKKENGGVGFRIRERSDPDESRGNGFTRVGICAVPMDGQLILGQKTARAERAGRATKCGVTVQLEGGPERYQFDLRLTVSDAGGARLNQSRHRLPNKMFLEMLRY